MFQIKQGGRLVKLGKRVVSISPALGLVFLGLDASAQVDLVDRTCMPGFSVCEMSGTDLVDVSEADPNVFEPGAEVSSFRLKDDAAIRARDFMFPSFSWNISGDALLELSDRSVLEGSSSVSVVGGDARFLMSGQSAAQNLFITVNNDLPTPEDGNAIISISEAARVDRLTTSSRVGSTFIDLGGNAQAGQLSASAAAGDVTIQLAEDATSDFIDAITFAGTATIVMDGRSSTSSSEDHFAPFAVTAFSTIGASEVIMRGDSYARSIQAGTSEGTTNVQLRENSRVGTLSAGSQVVGDVRIEITDRAEVETVGVSAGGQDSVAALQVSGLATVGTVDVTAAMGRAFFSISDDATVDQSRVSSFNGDAAIDAAGGNIRQAVVQSVVGSASAALSGRASIDELTAFTEGTGSADIKIGDQAWSGRAVAIVQGTGPGEARVSVSGNARVGTAGSQATDGDATLEASETSTADQLGAITHGVGNALVRMSGQARSSRSNALAHGAGDASLEMSGSSFSERAGATVFGGGRASAVLSDSAMSDILFAEAFGVGAQSNVEIREGASAGSVFADSSEDAVIQVDGTATSLEGFAQNIFVINSRSGIILGDSIFTADTDFSFVNEGEIFGDVEARSSDGFSVGTIENAGLILSSGDLSLLAERIINRGTISSANGILFDRLQVTGVYADAGGSVVIDVDFVRGADIITIHGSIEGVMLIELVDRTDADASVAEFLSRIDIATLKASDPSVVESQQVAVINNASGIYKLDFEEQDGDFRWFLTRDDAAFPVVRQMKSAEALHGTLLRAMHERSFVERRTVVDTVRSGAQNATDIRIVDENVTIRGGQMRDSFQKVEIEHGVKLGDTDRGLIIGSLGVLHGKISAQFTDRGLAAGISGYRTDSLGATLGLTWLNEDGYYVDGRFTFYQHKLQINNLTDKISGGGVGLNLEFGREFKLQNGWSITPSTQVSVARSKTEKFSFRNAEFAKVSTTGRRARVGISVANEWIDKSGSKIRTFASFDALKDSGGPLSRGSWSEFGLGATYEAKDSGVSLNAAINVPMSGAGAGDDLRASISATWRF